MKKYIKTKRNKTRRNKTKRNKMKKNKVFRGGLVNPFYEAGTIFNNINSGIQSAISSLSVPPIQGYNPVNPSSAPSSQYLSNTLTKPISTYN